MSLVSAQNLTQPPPEYKNSTVLFSFHVKKVTLKPWVTKYLDSVPLKLEWELESLEKDLNLGDQASNVLTRWESSTFTLDGVEASNVDTVFLLAQTLKEKETLILNSCKLKVTLVISNSTNVIVGSCSWNLDKFKVRSKFNPHSFELTNESKMFIGYVDIFYVSQQRWVRINKGSLPMINKNESEFNSSPESNLKTVTDSDRRTDDGTRLSCSSFDETDSPFSSADTPREDYVLIFWNSTNTCFVKSNPNDIQLQLLFMFIKTCLIDGNSPNSVIPFELEDIKPDEPFEVLKRFSSSFKPLSYSDAKHFIHIPHSQRTSSKQSSFDNNLENLEDDAKTATTEESNFEIQHSARLYSSSVPNTDRLLSGVDINDPTSFYNFISKQNKHFQSILSKHFLSPTSSLSPLTETSSVQDLKKPKYISLSQSTDNASTRYDSLPSYSKSIDTMASFCDITQKTTNTMTTGLVSYRNQSSRALDEEAMTIGDSTMTTTKTLAANLPFQEDFVKDTSKKPQTVVEDPKVLSLQPKDSDLSKINENEVVNEEATEKPQSLEEVGNLDTCEVPQKVHDSPDYESNASSIEVPREPATKKSDGDYVTPSKSSITVYSIYSPKDYIESFSEITDSPMDTDSDTLPNSTSQSPSNLKNTIYGLESAQKDKKIDKYFKNVQNAYYIPDSDMDPVNMLSTYTERPTIKGNRALHCERSLLNFDTISKDLQTIGELKSATDPDIGSFDSSLIFRALQDAQILKVQGQTLPTSAYLRLFLKYLKSYNSKRVPIVVYLQVITFKQLETMKRLSSSTTDILNFINISLEALIYELQVSTSVNLDLSDPNQALLFQKTSSFRNRTESDEESENLFLFESEAENLSFSDLDVNSVLSGDKHLIFQNIVQEISREAQNVDTRRLVYLSRLNSPPVKNRGCVFRITALKVVLYRTFCGRRKLFSNGHLIKL